MKHKLTLTLYSFLLVCCFSLCINAQQHAFDLNIVNYSDKPDANIEHLHLLSLTNNSNKVLNYSISSQEIICKTEYDDVVSNKIGDVDNNEEVVVNEKNSSSLTVEIYNKALSKKIDKMILNPNESIEFYVKITRHNNTEMGTLKCFKIATHLLDNEKAGKYVIIRTFIPNPNILRH
ncbi:hypothetical protein Q4Q34_16535 [Flavivirga abyssicola]|uniref:hypothetical protein n=1 Tax=Flavivirga abyssicola TaxID=3063533 RepID=UPI0026DF4E49|nr:hypothetical protein [Flavivirga sp. MEBiC07777]WVK12825.1 hypothetical protein Q4Q34_16535 [Flavivirga sp. MEBiC07777]